MALELEDREAELLSHWILTGQWVQRPARDLLDIRFLEESKEKVVLAVSVTKGRVEARLALCTSTYDPILLEVTTAAGTECWEYQKWKVSRASCSARHPTRIKHRYSLRKSRTDNRNYPG